MAGVYRERERETDFGARRNPRSAADLEEVAVLCYEEKSCREQDFEFANTRGFVLSRKIRTHLHPGVDPDCRVVIGRDLYSVSHVDKSARDMHIYMTSVGKVEEPG